MPEHNGRRVVYESRDIDELLGEVIEHRRSAGAGSGYSEGYYLKDSRPDSPYRAHHEGNEWVCYYCHPHPDVTKAWQRHMGSTSDPEFGIGSIEVIRWADGRTVCIGTRRSFIGSLWLTIQDAEEG